MTKSLDKFLPVFMIFSLCFISNTNAINYNQKMIYHRIQRFEQRKRTHKFSLATRSPLLATSFNIIKDDFLLNDDANGGARQENPSLTISQSGNAIITWTDFRDGNADIYYQRFDFSGNFSGSNFRVNCDAGMMWQGQPSVSSDYLENFIVAWEDRRLFNSDVYLQRINSLGVLIDTNFRANDNTGTTDQRNTAIIYLPNKNFIVAWDDWRNDWGDIYAQRYDSIGNPLGVNFKVNDDASGSNQYYPSIACDSTGEFIIVWMDGRQGNWNIFGQRFNNNGLPVGSNFRINSDGGNTYHADPKVSCTKNGQFIVTWEDQRQGNSDIYCQRFDINGNPLGSNFKVNNDIGTSSQLLPDIAIGNNIFVVTWSDNQNGNYDIYAQMYNINASPIGQNFRVNTDFSIYDQSESRIAFNTTGEFWIVWKDHQNINSDIYLQRFYASGSPINNNIKVNDDIASSHQRCSWICQDGFGNYIVTWEDERNINCDIYGLRFDSLGNTLGSNFRINDDLTNTDQYYTSIASDFIGDFIVTWTDGRNGNYDIYAQQYSSSGFPVGNNFRVSDDTNQSAQWYPIVSCDSIGNSAIVWMDYRNNNYDIYGQLYNAQANPIGSNFLVNDNTNSSQLYPFIARNRIGNFVVVWMDNRNNNYDIYAQRYDNQGNMLGINFKVNDDITTSSQGYPAVAIDNIGNFCIVWEDDRNGTTDIYLQKYDANGLAIGSNFRVDDDIADFDQYSPTIACDETGRYVIVWCDFRNNDDDPEIYAQAFDVNGARIGNNQLINQPDLFPANNQWLIGQSITANNRRIGFAWIDNRRHKGWDIYSKIVDWNYFSGINEDNNKHLITSGLIKISPNPTANKIYFTPDLSSINDISIYDINGQKINSVIKTKQNIDISNLKPGIYFLHYKVSGKSDIKKIVFTGRKNVKY